MISRSYQALIVGMLTTLLTMTVQAAPRDDFPSCYGQLGGNAPQLEAPQRGLFVIIDETVDANQQIRKSVLEKALHFIGPGDELNVIRFAAYTGDHYTQLMLKGRIDPRLDDSQRYSISKRALGSFDNCFNKQAGYVKAHLVQAINSSFGDGKTEIPKTELIGNLSSLSMLVKESNAKEKVVLLFSDMLENSDITTFYRSGNVRNIKPQHELARLDASGLAGNWGGASVYVVGAGLIAKNANAYRSEQTMNGLKDFWSAYFKRSNAILAGWGAPMLLVDLP